MNKVILIGNLTRDPEMRETTSGHPCAKFTIAINQGEEKTLFIDCVAWRTLAENVGKYVHKGGKVAVVGKLEDYIFVDRNGEQRKGYQVTCSEVEFLTRPQQTVQQPTTPKQPQQQMIEVEDDGDMPF